MDELLLGLDLGTSALKAALFNPQGQMVGLVHRPYPTYHPHHGWAEQEPSDWWTAAQKAIGELLLSSQVPPQAIAAVGLSGQTPGHVLVDEEGRSLGRALIWQDRRATAEAAWMAEEFSPDDMLAFTGLPLQPDSALPPARLLWLREHRPQDWTQARWVLQPKDFLAFRLTGQVATDHLSAYALLHIEDHRYHEEYFRRLGLPLEKMPPALAPSHVVGHVTPEAAKATGLLEGTPVAIGTIDAWCDVLGAGGVVEGRAVDVAGTSEIVALVGRARRHVPGIVSMPLIGDLSFIGGPTQVGGDAVRWVGNLLYSREGDDLYALLEEEAARSGPGAGGVLFLPYLAGERAPIWDDRACGAFVGCRQGHGRAHLARAVYEGVAFAIRHILTLAERAAGITVAEVRVCGGGSHSRFWNQLKADVTGKRVLELKVAETAVLGAAMWAAVAIGLYPDMETAARCMTEVKAELWPEPSLKDRYDALFALYQSLYPALQEVFVGLDGWRGRYSDAGGSADAYS